MAWLRTARREGAKITFGTAVATTAIRVAGTVTAIYLVGAEGIDALCRLIGGRDIKFIYSEADKQYHIFDAKTGEELHTVPRITNETDEQYHARIKDVAAAAERANAGLLKQGGYILEDFGTWLAELPDMAKGTAAGIGAIAAWMGLGKNGNGIVGMLGLATLGAAIYGFMGYKEQKTNDNKLAHNDSAPAMPTELQNRLEKAKSQERQSAGKPG